MRGLEAEQTGVLQVVRLRFGYAGGTEWGVGRGFEIAAPQSGRPSHPKSKFLVETQCRDYWNN